METLWGDWIKDYNSVPNIDNWNGITSLELEHVDRLDTLGMCIDEIVRISDNIVKLTSTRRGGAYLRMGRCGWVLVQGVGNVARKHIRIFLVYVLSNRGPHKLSHDT